MALTGWPLRLLLALAAGATFVVIVLWWPRLAETKPGKVAARAGLLVAVNLLVIATLAVQVNAHYLFYADWTDLHGAFTGHLSKTSVSRGGSALRASRTVVHGNKAKAPSHPTLLTSGKAEGDPVSYTVRGPLSGIESSVFIALPPGYRAAANGTKRYPVLEAFHGYPGGPSQWFATMDLPGELKRSAAAGRVQAALVVTPELEVPAGVDTECVNGSQGYPQMETWLAQDVPNWVAAHFRVQPDRSAWATIGISAGAWCAAAIAMLHPAQFGAAIVLGGYFRPDFGAGYPPYPPRGPQAARYDLVSLAHGRPPPLALWLETSHSDPVSYSSSAAFLGSARAPLAVSAVVLRHAGHHVGLWIQLLPDSLTWLGKNVAGFRPAVA